MRRLVWFPLAGALLAGSASAQTSQPVTFWARGGTIDTANAKLVTVGKVPAKIRLGKACAGTAGQFQGWQAMSVDPRGSRDGEVVEIVTNGVPANAEVIGSLRVEGSCTEGGATWTKYSGVLEKAKKKTPPPKPAPTATPSAAKPPN